MTACFTSVTYTFKNAIATAANVQSIANASMVSIPLQRPRSMEGP